MREVNRVNDLAALALVLACLVVLLALLAGCTHCQPCPACVPEVVHETMTVTVPLVCPAVQVDQPVLILRPGTAPVTWPDAPGLIEHDYRALAGYYLTTWPQILAQRQPPPTPTPAPH
jgi:hypothetical protein